MKTIRNQIIAFYLSSRREQPEADQLDMEVRLAAQDWEEIPTDNLVEVCAEARKQSGEFMVGNGLVARIWREEMAERRRPRSQPFVALPPPPAPTEEEKASLQEMFASVRSSLGPGARPKGWRP